MEFQHDNSWDCLTSVLASKLSATDAWNKLIDFHEKIVPKPYWTSLRQIDIEGEQKEIAEWLQHLVKTSPIPGNVAALWIGILKFADDDDKEILTIYLAGTETYNKEEIDWACNPVYFPENRHAQLPLMQQIDEIARTDKGNYEFFDWILPLAYCTFTFDEIIRTKLDKKLFLKSKDRLFAVVGHDSGDYMELSDIVK